MPKTLSNVIVHIVFSTKERKPFLRDAKIREEVHRYLGGISKAVECFPIIVGGTEDHVHILAQQFRDITIARWVKELKRVSSVWIKTKGNEYKNFQWQCGYGAFSVSQSLCEKVRDYIQKQAEHHKKLSFQEEFRAMLERNGIKWDERYVWG